MGFPPRRLAAGVVAPRSTDRLEAWENDCFRIILPRYIIRKMGFQGQGARRRPGAMELRRSTMGSPLSALLSDCVAPVLRVLTWGGRSWLAA